MRFVILGPVQVRHASSTLRLPRAQNRGLLAYLLLNANRVVSLDAVTEALWGGAEPATARSQVHSAIHAIRRQLREAGNEEALVSGAGGYVLHADADALDVTRFQRLVSQARHAREGSCPSEASTLLREALGLWRGPALADATGAFVEAARSRLADQQLTAYEDLIDAELALGRHTEVIGEFAPLVDEHPLRERLRGQIMLALYRSGRQVDALASYQGLRKALADEQGLDPGQPLRDLSQAILRNDTALAPPPTAPPAEPEPAPPATVTELLPTPHSDDGPSATPTPAVRRRTSLFWEPRGRRPLATLDGAEVETRAGVPWRSTRARWVAAASVVAVAAAAWAVFHRPASPGTIGDVTVSATVAILNEGPPDSSDSAQYVLEVADYSTSEGAEVWLWPSRKGTENVRHQLWIAEGAGSGEGGVSRVRFKNVNSEKCLDRGHGGSEEKVFQSTCSEAASQLWWFDETGHLRNARDDRCLAIQESLLQAGAAVRMDPCDSGWNQQWTKPIRKDWS